MSKDNQLGIAGGMIFDYTQMLGEKRLSKLDLEKFAPQLAAASDAVRKTFETGFSKAHLSKDGTPEHVFFARQAYLKEGYPNDEESIARLENFGESLRGKCDVVLSLGIGGSYLGDKMLFDLGAGAYWNEMTDAERQNRPRVYFSGNNLDTVASAELLAQLKRLQAAKNLPLRVHLIVISKSGTTLETLGSFSYFYGSLHGDENFVVDVTAVTGLSAQESAMFRLAQRYGWECYSIPEGIGGRWCVLSNPGLIMAAVIGYDIRGLLAGARDVADVCLSVKPLENPALVNAGLKYLAAEKSGRDLEVFMGYGNNLKSVSEWYVQLCAESLGKRFDREGKLKNYGRTPIVAVGTTDMHAQTQQHQDGKLNKVVQFLQVENPSECIELPNPFPEEKAFAKAAGRNMQRLLDVAMESNEQALAGDERPSARYILPELTPRTVGQLLMFLMFSIAYEGELADIDAYDQPGVEAYKKIMNATLAK